ncbi:MAG: hypothetical protein J1E41_00845 [Ruminococcus sp.]|nr:hypothetical protein [Ruminococcus sp.]
MKKTACMVIAVIMLVCIVFSGCTGSYDKSPDQYDKIRWAAPDYSFIINPTDDCKGTYKFDDTKYNIKVEFDTVTLTAYDTDKKDTVLFKADWMYEDDDLYIYNIVFNTTEYKNFEDNFAEFVTLKQEKI